MRLRCIFLVAIAALTVVTPARSFAQSSLDRVHRHNGVDTGKITAVTPLGVTIEKSGVESTISVEDIVSVYWAGEPGELNAARAALQAGRPQDAARLLAAMATPNATRDEILAELDFYALLAKAHLALTGQGDLAAATAEARNFLARRRTSFHVPQAIEVVGDLLVAAGQYEEARAEYAKLVKARSPYFDLRSALLAGRAWQAEGEHARAVAEFDKALAGSGSGAIFESLELSATLDRSVSQAAVGGGEDAAAAIGAIIAKADPEDGPLLARAYVALGDCYRQAGDSQGALFAYLHVDLLYNNSPDAHAKALHELVALWRESGHENRSQEAARELAEKYPGSRWAR